MKAANDNGVDLTTGVVQPISVSSANCVAVTGMSWTWVLRFARAHGVPIWRVGPRKQLVPGAPLAAAMAEAAAATKPPSFDDQVEAWNARILADLG